MLAHVEKFTDSKNAVLFDLRRKVTKLLRKNRFRTVASPGACERLAVLNDARRQCILLVLDAVSQSSSATMTLLAKTMPKILLN